MPPARRRSPSTRVYGGFVNPTGITYIMIGGPFHQSELALPHPVKEYKPVVEGNEEEYILNEVTFFNRRIPVLIHSSIYGNEPRATDSLAHGMLQGPVFQIWQRATPSFPQPVDMSLGGQDDTRIEPPLAETPR